MIPDDILNDLRCPASQQALAVADDELVTRVNRAIEGGALKNVGGEVVTDAIEGALVRSDGEVLYPVRQGFPNLLADEGIGTQV